MNIRPSLFKSCTHSALLALLMMHPLVSWGGVLKKMDAKALPGDMVELRLMFDGPAPTAKGYSIEQPPRISIDLPYTSSALPKYNEVGFENAKSVTVLEVGDRTRLVVNLDRSTRFSTRGEGNALYVYLGGDGATADPVTGGPSVSHTGAPVALATGNGISHIDFKRGKQGEGNVVITLEDPSMPVDMNEESGRILLEFTGEVLPGRLRNRLDVVDFATAVQFIDANVVDGNTVIAIEPKGQFEYLAYQTDNQLTVSVKSTSDRDKGRKPKGLTYKGDKLSLNFQDIEVRAVLQLIADFTDLNLVASDTVGGSVTLRLQNVPWDQALDIVLKSKGLDKRLAGNVLTVAPAAELASREREQLENEKQIRDLAPVYTDLIQINYADASEISEVLAGGEGESLLTERGSVQVVARTNSLMVKDTQAKLDEIRALIEKLDVPVRQVMIEARIVSLDNTLKEELGVKWSGGVEIDDSTSRKIGIGGTGSNASKVDGSPSFGLGDNVFTDLNVNQTNSSAITLGFASNSTILNLELSALLSDGGGETISRPKLVTADKTTAIIKTGKEVPYEEKTSSGATSTAFKDAVLGLEVTPQITPDGSVIMDIKINNNDTTSDAVNGVPILSTDEITTRVFVRDGETVILGGVFKQIRKNSLAKVPFLGDLPYVGSLFKKTTEEDTKEELMVFITPRIISDGIKVP